MLYVTAETFVLVENYSEPKVLCVAFLHSIQKSPWQNSSQVYDIIPEIDSHQPRTECLLKFTDLPSYEPSYLFPGNDETG